MSWSSPYEHPDSRRRLAELIEEPGYPAPLPFVDLDSPLSITDIATETLLPASPHPTSRLLHGPFIMNGDLCDILPGPEAVVMVSPQGDRILMQNEGKVTLHVPAGWRLIVGSKPLRSQKSARKPAKVGQALAEEEEPKCILHAENIPALYKEADSFS